MRLKRNIVIQRFGDGGDLHHSWGVDRNTTGDLQYSASTLCGAFGPGCSPQNFLN